MGFKARKSRKLSVRQLVASEVEFTVRVEQEVEHPDGYFAYDTAEENEQATRWVLEQLDAGNELAWCCVYVTARWRSFEAQDSLGAVSCSDRADFEQNILPDMKAEALAQLQAAIERAATDVAELAE